MIDLTGTHALVTGASRGIGAAAAKALARAGASVTIAYHVNQSAALLTLRQLEEAGASSHAVAGDLATAADASSVVAAAEQKLGPVDILVCNAGIWKRAPVDGMTDVEWDETLDANLKSAFLMCRAVVPNMKTRRQGNLILIASTAGQRGEASYSHYAASKGGIIAFTKSLAAELGPFGLRVNCVAPGWVRTDMTEAVFADPRRRQEIVDGTPLGRIAMPEDIAGPILFLASDLACHVHGEVLNVNGGSVLCG